MNILKTEQAAEYLQLSKASLDRWRCYGGGPVFVRMGRVIRYRRADLDKWMDGRTATSTSDTGGAK